MDRHTLESHFFRKKFFSEGTLRRKNRPKRKTERKHRMGYRTRGFFRKNFLGGRTDTGRERNGEEGEANGRGKSGTENFFCGSDGEPCPLPRRLLNFVNGVGGYVGGSTGGGVHTHPLCTHPYKSSDGFPSQSHHRWQNSCPLMGS